jgi:ParB/RepB/Spo0J family partition protein
LVTAARSRGFDPAVGGGSAGHAAGFSLRNIPVDLVRPEEGLGRKRDLEGHKDLQRSIAQFGVLTPITVRPDPTGSGNYLLIKGQGRTLACKMLGIATIPALVADGPQGETEKVQQFLVENVARLKMRPVDRALLIKRARDEGEETAHIARRFGVSPTTVRRLLVQLEGASTHEVEALRAGDLSLALHAVVARHVGLAERSAALGILSVSQVKPREAESVFVALGWRQLCAIRSDRVEERLVLLEWACNAFANQTGSSIQSRLREVARRFPLEFRREGQRYSVVSA